MEESENESESTPQETNEEDQPVVEFEVQAYELPRHTNSNKSTMR